MKKVLILLGILFTLLLIAKAIHLPSQILGLLLVGLIPFTNSTVPALMMFFIWVLFPFALVASIYAIKGLFILTLLAVEYIEYGTKEYIDARRAAHKPLIPVSKTAFLATASRIIAHLRHQSSKVAPAFKQLLIKKRSSEKSS